MKPTHRYDIRSGKFEALTPSEPKRRGPSVHTRFRPFVTEQLSKHDAAAIGAERSKGGSTYIGSERQLNELLARRPDIGWKQ